MKTHLNRETKVKVTLTKKAESIWKRDLNINLPKETSGASIIPIKSIIEIYFGEVQSYDLDIIFEDDKDIYILDKYNNIKETINKDEFISLIQFIS